MGTAATTPDPAPTPAPAPTESASYTREALDATPIVDLLTDEALKKDPSLASFKGLEGLARSYSATKKMVGGDASAFLKIPTDATPAEELDKFYNTLGRPETPDAYVVPEPVKADQERLMIKTETLTDFGKVAHAAGLTNQQFQKVVDWYRDFADKDMAAIGTEFDALQQQSDEALRTKWGEAYESNMQMAKAATRAITKDIPEFDDLLTTPFLVGKGRLGDDPRMVLLLQKVGLTLREDEMKDGRTGTGASFEARLSPAQAQAEINGLKADPEFYKRWMDARNPGHADAVRRMERLYEQAYPEPAK